MNNENCFRHSNDQRFLGLIPFALGVAAAPLFYRPKCCPQHYHPPYPQQYSSGGVYAYNYQYAGYNTGYRNEESAAGDDVRNKHHKHGHPHHGHHHGHHGHHKKHYGYYRPPYWHYTPYYAWNSPYYYYVKPWKF